jgi:peptide/nickel transport system substrate-binding protein
MPRRRTGSEGLHAKNARRILLACGIALAACTPARAPDVVVYASGADLESANPLVTIHPLARQIQRYALFVTLAQLDSELQPRPYFARAWHWSPDKRTLTLDLYRGLRWHDGAPTTARDVAFTLEAARDPQTGFARAAELAEMSEAEAVGDSAVRLHFRQAPPGFPEVLCELPIAPAHLLDSIPHGELRRAAFGFAPVGNGPFRFVERDAGRRWVFERVADFPVVLGGPAHVQRLVIAVVDEPTTKFAGLVSGDLDVAGIAPAMASLVADDPSLRIITYPSTVSTAIVFNVASAPFTDVRVRRAIDALIDRQRVIDAALAGYATPAVAAVPSGHPYAIPIDRASTAQADSLLDASGWTRSGTGRREREGKPLQFTLLTVGTGDNAIEQLIQADLRDHGITMEIRQMELGAFLAAARATPKRFDALITGIPGDLTLSHLAAMFSSRLAGSALDYSGFHTPRLDSLFAHAATAVSELAVADAWRAVQRELARDVPVSWVYYARGVQGVTRRLAGIRMDLRGELPTLTEWRVRSDTTRPDP